jgi:23S rRNA (uracil1939-C5)-methyltransferase
MNTPPTQSLQDTITIESLDMEGRGVGHLDNEDGTPGKVIFVEAALPGEIVKFKSKFIMEANTDITKKR